MPDAEIKRLTMRSWRRGMREMDLILGPFADSELASMTRLQRESYDRLLSENDQDLYSWIAGGAAAPANMKGVVQRVRAFHALD